MTIFPNILPRTELELGKWPLQHKPSTPSLGPFCRGDDNNPSPGQNSENLPEKAQALSAPRPVACSDTLRPNPHPPWEAFPAQAAPAICSVWPQTQEETARGPDPHTRTHSHFSTRSPMGSSPTLVSSPMTRLPRQIAEPTTHGDNLARRLGSSGLAVWLVGPNGSTFALPACLPVRTGWCRAPIFTASFLLEFFFLIRVNIPSPPPEPTR